MKGWSVAAGIFTSLVLLFGIWDWKDYPWFFRAHDPFADPVPANALEEFQALFATQPRWVMALQHWKLERRLKRVEIQHAKECWEALANFSFEDKYLACEDPQDGRWFIHFTKEDTIRVATPRNGTRVYRPSGYDMEEAFVPVPLDTVFTSETTYQRTEPFTLVLTTPTEIHTYSLIPNLYTRSPDDSTSALVLEDIQNPEIRFLLSNSPEWESDFHAFWERGESYGDTQPND